MVKIGFWKKETGNLMSHSGGLTPDQIDFLHSLLPGDRLICWQNTKRMDTDPDYSLAKYESKGKPIVHGGKQ